MGQFTDADRTFLLDPETWAWGPMFDMTWCGERRDADSLLETLLCDPAIFDFPQLSGLDDDDRRRRIWFPEDLPPIGMVVTRHALGVEASIYPPHVKRATGFPWFADENYGDPRVVKFFLAAIRLTNRLHRCEALERADLFDEVFDETGAYWSEQAPGIAIYVEVAVAAGWKHEVPRGWPVAILPMGEEPSPTEAGSDRR